VARHELFEKPGERAPTSPLPEAGAEGEEDEDEDGLVAAPEDAPVARVGARLVSASELERALTPRGRPLVVHHWATWCEPCAEELPRIEALAKALGDVADVVGVSWELFDSQEPPKQALGTVDAYAEGMGLSWPTLVFKDGPEALFKVLELDFQQIPQTRVLGPDGACLEDLQRPLEAADVTRLSERLSGVQS